MSLKDFISKRTLHLLLAAIFLCFVLYSYDLQEDIDAAKRSINTKQKELANVIKLKDIYIAKKNSIELKSADASTNKAFTYSFFEQRVSNHFVIGKLKSLKPVTIKGDRGQEKKAMDVKISGAALSETLAFIKTVESEGLKVSKLSLTMGAGQNLLEINMTVTL